MAWLGRTPMNLDPTTLALSLIFGLIGMAMFMYGKKVQRISCIAAGLALMTVPYLIPGHLVLFLVCSALTATPMVWKA